MYKTPKEIIHRQIKVTLYIRCYNKNKTSTNNIKSTFNSII